MDGKHPENLDKILQGEMIGTHFQAQTRPVNARKHWISNVLIPTGKLYLDQGAIQAITQKGKSLLAAGILQVEGEFRSQDSVKICDQLGQEIARGLVNYSSVELQQIKGLRSEKIPEVLGYHGAETIIHRDNLVMIH
jgi:glutamate 5-kinase